MKMLYICCWLCLPLKVLHLNSGFGDRVHPLTGDKSYHSGIDLRAAAGDTAFAMLDGKAIVTGYHPKLGVFLRIRHGEIITEYGHLDRSLVAPGQIIAAGTPVAITGYTGQVTAAHLHFSIFYRQRPVDPVRFLYQLIKKHHE